MAIDTEALRRQVEAQGPRGRGRRFAPALRAQLVEAVHQLRAEGWPWTRIAAALGVTAQTVQRWSTERATDASLVPVEVAAERAQGDGLVVVSPSGYRVEGLSLEQAASLLRNRTGECTLAAEQGFVTLGGWRDEGVTGPKAAARRAGCSGRRSAHLRLLRTLQLLVSANPTLHTP